jgi:hypothetical protein
MSNLNYWEISPIVSPDHESQHLYDYRHPEAPKAIWRRHEFEPTSDYLMSHRDALRNDFLRGFTNLKDSVIAKNLKGVLEDREDLKDIDIRNMVTDKKFDFAEAQNSLRAWKSLTIKYEHKTLGKNFIIDLETAKNYPTAYKLIKKYGANCGIAGYSVIEPRSVIERHTGPENRDGEYLRIHIPLIIPEGDVFFEVLGEEIDWSDIWGFNNQLIHSAHNNTDEYRLVFIIDLSRTAIGLEPGVPFDPEWQINAKTFVREIGN